MRFQATQEQLFQMIVNAINASVPVGMGFLHYEKKNYTVAEFLQIAPVAVLTNVDYFRGRMVKLWFKNLGEGVFQLPAENPDLEYQSWASRYPTYQSLLASAGLSPLD